MQSKLVLKHSNRINSNRWRNPYRIHCQHLKWYARNIITLKSRNKLSKQSLRVALKFTDSKQNRSYLSRNTFLLWVTRPVKVCVYWDEGRRKGLSSQMVHRLIRAAYVAVLFEKNNATNSPAFPVKPALQDSPQISILINGKTPGFMQRNCGSLFPR